MAIETDKSQHPFPYLVPVFAAIGHTYSHLFLYIYFTALLVLQDDPAFPTNKAELNALAASGTIAYGIMALPAGMLADRWSTRGMLVFYFLGLGLSAVITGLAQGPFMLTLGLTLIGIFGAIYHPVGTDWLIAHTKRPGHALGINGMFGPVGNALAPILTAFFIDSMTWRTAFFVPAGFTIITGLAMLSFWRLGLLPAMAENDHHAITSLSISKYRKASWSLALAITLGAVILNILNAETPKIFEIHLNDWTGGKVVGIGLLAGLIQLPAALASWIGGILTERFHACWVYIMMWIVQIPLFVFAASLTGDSLFMLLASVMFMVNAVIPVENFLLARLAPANKRATAYGLKFVLAFVASGVTLPVSGYALDQFESYAPLMYAMAIMALMSCFCAWLLPRELSQPPTKKERQIAER